MNTVVTKFSWEDCWTLIAVPISDEGVGLTELIARMDALNHSIPSKKEIENGLTIGIQNGILIEENKNYKLNQTFFKSFEEVLNSKGGLFSLVDKLQNKLNKLAIQKSNNITIQLSDEEFEKSIDTYSSNFERILNKKK